MNQRRNAARVALLIVLALIGAACVPPAAESDVDQASGAATSTAAVAPACTPGEQRTLVLEDLAGNSWFHLTAGAGSRLIERTFTLPDPVPAGTWEAVVDVSDPANEMPDTPNEQLRIVLAGAASAATPDIAPGVADPPPMSIGSIVVPSTADTITFQHVGDSDWNLGATDSVYVQSVRLRCLGDGNEPNPAIGSIADGTCVGIRGNGARIFAHFGALARLVENYGPISCAAGGSSGSISTFVIESMESGPLWHTCGGAPCSDVEANARLGLMMKSFIGLVDVGIGADVSTLLATSDDIQAGNIGELIATGQATEAVDALIRVLRDVGPLINEDAITLLRNSPDPLFHATEMIEGLQNGVAFQVDTGDVFVRTGILDWPAFAEFLGQYGSFYANYGPADVVAFDAWLDQCAVPGFGLTWDQIETLPGSGSQTCGSEFMALFDTYREAFAAAGSTPSRIDDPVGRYLPTFGVTGVLTGDAVTQYEAARAAWLAAEPIEFTPDFNDIGTGWWGREEDLATMQANLTGTDLGSTQFTPLGEQPWSEILAASPAEPGFTEAVPLASGFLSVGGWADPLRVLPLQALGAEHVVSINRRNGIGGFTEDVTVLLGAGPSVVAQLYGFPAGSSTFSISLAEAEGVWCTDWDTPDQTDVDGMFLDAYNAPFLSDDPFFTSGPTPYAGVTQSAQIVGCTAGLVPTANSPAQTSGS